MEWSSNLVLSMRENAVAEEWRIKKPFLESRASLLDQLSTEVFRFLGKGKGNVCIT